MRACEEHTFETLDTIPIFYRRWPSNSTNQQRRAIVLLHRGHEHSGRMQFLVDEMDLPGYTFFAWDARGHGRSPGRRGHAPSISALVKDLDTFIRHIADRHAIQPENIAVIGQSVGSVLAAAWAHDYAPNIRAMVLAAPAFRIKLYVPLARTALSFVNKLFPSASVQSYVKARYLTHDRERAAAYESDPLITRAISVNVLLDVYATAERVVSDAAAIHTPTQVLISGSDYVVHKKPQRTFFERLGSKTKELHELSGFYHDTLGEQNRHLAISKVRHFLESCFARPLERPSLLDADVSSETKDEFDRLSKPLFPLTPKAIAYGVTRGALRLGGRLSGGMRIGLQTGFDSGSSLDYVYRNQPSGITPLGKLADWLYLNSIGWCGIRVRRQHLERMISRAVAELRVRGLVVNVVDIAAGHGRYILDSIAGQPNSADRIVLRDQCPENVRRGTEMIAERSLGSVASFEQGDAFDRQSLLTLNPRPTLAVVSGLYELFPDNRLLRESLAGLSEAVLPSGFIIYTGQPWHPQLEMIARTLPSHRDRRPWVMRRRTQAELDQLVGAAGFRKIDQFTDQWGIFTVSLAQRVAAS